MSCRQLKLESPDGRKYATDCSTTENLFRIIQSIPSPKAEPFKQWLAKVGYERVQEIEDPGLAQERMNHMTDFELIFTMLGEKVTTEISQKEKPDTFPKSKQVARRGGNVAGVARKETEKELGRSIISDQIFFDKTGNDESPRISE